MRCPKCFQDNVVDVGTHYVCQNPDCHNEENGKVQFRVVNDSAIHFPYSQIFRRRKLIEFYRKPYLQVASAGQSSVR